MIPDPHAASPPLTPVLFFDEFLVASELRALLDYTLARGGDFTGTHVVAADGSGLRDDSYRRSRVLYDLGPFESMFGARLRTFLPHVLARLDYPWFPVRHLEIQLTASNNGEFFRVHTDNGSKQDSSVGQRALTFVYFFHREPRAFSGGEMRLYDTRHDGGSAVAAGPYRIVQPLQNQVVFFDSSSLHEIVPVGCPSGDFADSRFTVNGWFHR